MGRQGDIHPAGSRRAADSVCTVAEDVGVDHGRRHAAVAEELRDGAGVVTALQKVGREGMAGGVAAGTLADNGGAGSMSCGRASISDHAWVILAAREVDVFEGVCRGECIRVPHQGLCDTLDRSGRIRVDVTPSACSSSR